MAHLARDETVSITSSLGAARKADRGVGPLVLGEIFRCFELAGPIECAEVGQ
jgi:hypothetical protein